MSLTMSNTFQKQIVSIMEVMATAVLAEMSKGFESSATLCIEMSESHENKTSKVIFPVVEGETRMTKLASVVEVLAQEAVNKICELAMEELAVLRSEVSQSRNEIGTLKRKLEQMEKELRTLQGGAAGERPLNTHSDRVQDTCELGAAEPQEPHSTVVSVWGNAVPTSVAEKVAPVESVGTIAEPSIVEDGIETVIIKEEGLEELAISKEEMPAAADQNRAEEFRLPTQGTEGQPTPARTNKSGTPISPAAVAAAGGMDKLTEQLILWRGANARLFTGRRNAALKGFATFIKDMGLEGMVTVAYMKKKWENLKQRYKELKNQPTGGSTEGAEITAATWKWFAAMDKVLGSSRSLTPLAVGSSSVPGGTAVSLPSEERADGSCFSSTASSTATATFSSTATATFSSTATATFSSTATATSTYSSASNSTFSSASNSSSTAPEAPPTSPAPKRAKKDPDWFMAIKELEKREEARDAREAEWERVMMEREDRREREMIDREERREREMLEREDRRDREMRDREERLIRESREREDRRAREAAAREARFLSVMDFLLKK